MFQRLKASIDRTIAEEQARSKTENPPIQRNSSTGSSSRPQTKRVRSQRTSQDVSADNAANPDPAVFEAAFVLDDSEEPSRAGTPKPPAMAEGTAGEAAGASTPAGPESSHLKNDASKIEGGDAAGDQTQKSERGKPTIASLPPEVRVKLRKLEKLESTYPELLRSYRIAHGRATSIEPFERVLKEHTSVASIREPEALVEFLNSLKMKEQLVMDEYKKVSVEKDEFKKKFEDTEKDLATLREEVATLKAGQPTNTVPDANGKDGEDATKEEAESGSGHARSSSSIKSPVQSVLGIFSPKQKPQPDQNDDGEKKDTTEDFFSYDDEIPQLQADLAAKTGQIDTLQAEVESLKQELAVAKESSAELVENLEKTTREACELRDSSAVSASLQTQIDARNQEIKSLQERLEATQTQLKETRDKLTSELELEKANVADLQKKVNDASGKADSQHHEVARLTVAKDEAEKQVKSLTDSIESLKKLKAEDDARIAQLTAKQQEHAASTVPDASASAPSGATEGPSAPPTTTPSSSTKKKNKKKKKGGAAAAATSTQEPSTDSQEKKTDADVTVSKDAASHNLDAEVSRLKEEVVQRDAQIEQLTKRRKVAEDLMEEIETLRDEITHIGQDNVEAKEKIKALESEKQALKSRIEELEKELKSATDGAKLQTEMEGDFQKLKQEYDDLKSKSLTLQSDVGAAQQLAQNRFKELTSLREILQKAQPEMKSLRQDSEALKSTREELTAKTTELRTLERRERDLKGELSRAQRLGSDREAEVKGLRDQIATLENTQRVSGRDLRRSEAEKIEISAREEKAMRELQEIREEVKRLRPRIGELEDEVQRLQTEKRIVREEADLRSQQYANAQSLLGSMREQTTELSIQAREAQSQSEALEEELAEVQKHLAERSREAERMRGLLADVDGRADNKVREMRSRMEAAIEERDRLEDESSTLARRKMRETEDLKQKIRELVREVKVLKTDQEDLEQKEREWRRRREELEAVEEKSDAEVTEMRSAVSDLRTALDASEQQVRDAEKQKNDLRRLLEEARQRYEKTTKDLKAAQAKLGSSLGSERSSMDSSRSGLNGSGSPAPGGNDNMYLKTILLQFLEQKDNRMREQLVPVLGRILRFDKNDEKKWRDAIQHISVR